MRPKKCLCQYIFLRECIGLDGLHLFPKELKFLRERRIKPILQVLENLQVDIHELIRRDGCALQQQACCFSR